MIKVQKYFFIVLFLFSASASFAFNPSVQAEDQVPNRNSLYCQNFIIFPTINFDRVIPINRKSGFIPKVGIGYYDDFVPILEASIYISKKRSYGEIGAGYWGFVGAVINSNYRFMGTKGLLVKAGFSYVPGEESFPLLGIGYSF